LAKNSIDIYPETGEPRVLPVGELVLWYGMFAPCGRLLGTMALPIGLHLKFSPHCAERLKKMAKGSWWEVNYFIEEAKRKGPPLISGPFQDV